MASGFVCLFGFFFPLLLSKYLKKGPVTCLMVTKLLTLVLAGERREGCLGVGVVEGLGLWLLVSTVTSAGLGGSLS